MQQINEKVSLFASDKSWIDGNAISQLKGTAELEGVQRVVGFPDLHPGKGGPVGAAIETKDMIYPTLIGNDVGCGIGLWMSDLQKRKAKLDKWTGKLTHLDRPWEGDAIKWLEERFLGPDYVSPSLGTIGHGNHFAELQAVERVEDEAAFKAAAMDEQALYVCVHSGSRGLGQLLLESHVAGHGYKGIDANSEDGQKYLKKHSDLVCWASANRALISHRFLEAIRSESNYVCDWPHNALETDVDMPGIFVHRKGAAPSRTTIGAPGLRTTVMIPGSRGAFSYLVECKEGDHNKNLWSIAHGAGRKWARSDCRARLSEKYKVQDLEQTDLGSRVICEDKDLIYEEAPQAYKNIDAVIDDLKAEGLVSVIAVFRPLITYKVRRDER